MEHGDINATWRRGNDVKMAMNLVYWFNRVKLI